MRMKKNGGFNIVLGEWGPYVNNPTQSVPTVLTMIVVVFEKIFSKKSYTWSSLSYLLQTRHKVPWFSTYWTFVLNGKWCLILLWDAQSGFHWNASHESNHEAIWFPATKKCFELEHWTFMMECWWYFSHLSSLHPLVRNFVLGWWLSLVFKNAIPSCISVQQILICF